MPVALADTKDYEGSDDWVGMVFDVNGDHSEPLYEISGTYAECVSRISHFITEGKRLQARIVVERVM